MIAVKGEYYHLDNGFIVEVVAMNEMKPNDPMIQMINKNKQHRVQPLVEFIDGNGNWHVLSLEDFTTAFKEIG